MNIHTKNLSHLSKEELIQQTQFLASEEKRIDLAFIDHLKEIENRKLYLEMAYSSLWDFCIRHLKLSEGSAQRKIAAMRLCRDIPEVQKSLEEGKLNLVNAAQLQSFFQAEKKEGVKRKTEDKKAIVDQVLGLSQKGCQQKLASISPQAALPKERERPLTQEKTQLNLVLDRETMDALKQLKGLLAHSVPSGSYSDLVKFMALKLLKQMERKKGGSRKDRAGGRSGPVGKEKLQDTGATITVAARSVNKKDPQRISSHQPVNLTAAVSNGSDPRRNQVSKPVSSNGVNPRKLTKTPNRPYIPAAIRQFLWQRSSGQCEFISSGGVRCESKFCLELDHIVPLALNGTHEVSNYRYVCRNHNQHLARLALGESRVGRHLRR